MADRGTRSKLHALNAAAIIRPPCATQEPTHAPTFPSPLARHYFGRGRCTYSARHPHPGRRTDRRDSRNPLDLSRSVVLHRLADALPPGQWPAYYHRFGRPRGTRLPFWARQTITSDDDGKSWSWPRTLLDGPIDDRDSGVLYGAKGTLLVTTFTSLAYEPTLAKANQEKNWDHAKLAEWNAVNARLSAEARKKALGVWMIRSTDGGVTWSARNDSLVNSPHGPIQLADGRQLYAGKDLWRDEERVGVCESTDDGQTWRWLAHIAPRTATITTTITSYMRLKRLTNGSSSRFATTTRRITAKRSRVNRPMAARRGQSHIRSAFGGCRRTCSSSRRPPRDDLRPPPRAAGQPGSREHRPPPAPGRSRSFSLRRPLRAATWLPFTVELADRTLLSVWYEESSKGAKSRPCGKLGGVDG